MPDPEVLERYFHRRADLAEKLYREDWRNEAVLIATVALDALATIWTHDRALGRQDAALRIADFVTKFGRDPRSQSIAVVLLAEDMLKFGPVRLRPIASRLLGARAVDSSRPHEMEFRESPRVYLDKSWEALIDEEPMLASETALQQVALHYTYPALLYRLQRCPVAHSLLRGTRTSDFSSNEPDDEISYFPAWAGSKKTYPIGLKIGLSVVTQWVRACATNYFQECAALSETPACDFDPAAMSLGKLAGKWTGV